MGGVHGRVQLRRHLEISVFRMPPAAPDYSRQMLWLIGCNNYLMNIHAKIILFHFRRGFMLK